jgi:hypothetical protein
MMDQAKEPEIEEESTIEAAAIEAEADGEEMLEENLSTNTLSILAAASLRAL